MAENNRVRLLQVIYGFGIGGGELKLLELLSRLDREKYDIRVVSVGLAGPLEDRFRALGFPTHVLAKRWRYDFTLGFKLARIMRETRAELMMTTLFFADIIGALATCLHRPKAFVSWEVITGQLRPHQILMYRLFSRRFDMVVAVSNSIHSFIRKTRGQDPRKIRTIHYGVDLQKFSVRNRKRKGDDVVFGTVSRLVHQKGHRYLLDAIPPVLRRHPRAKWQFVGSGGRERELREKAKRLGIERSIEFLGSREDIPNILRGFDVFVLPSLWEGFPNVLLEAMACGLPVIATAVEGTVELVVDGETGFLVPKEDSTALAEAMEKMLDDPQLLERFGRNGRKRVEEQFSLEKQIGQFESLYDDLIR